MKPSSSEVGVRPTRCFASLRQKLSVTGMPWRDPSRADWACPRPNLANNTPLRNSVGLRVGPKSALHVTRGSPRRRRTWTKLGAVGATLHEEPKMRRRGLGSPWPSPPRPALGTSAFSSAARQERSRLHRASPPSSARPTLGPGVGRPSVDRASTPPSFRNRVGPQTYPAVSLW